MIKTLIFDISYTLLFPKDSNLKKPGTLNQLHDEISSDPDFTFFDHFALDSPIIEELKKLKDTHNLLICTSGNIQEDPAIEPLLLSIFERVYSAEKLGMSKSEPAIYQHIIQENSLVPQETLFVDDLQKNTQTASRVGLQTHTRTSTESLLSALKSL